MSTEQKKELILQQLTDCQFYKTFTSKPKQERKKGRFVPVMAYLTEKARVADMDENEHDIHSPQH